MFGASTKSWLTLHCLALGLTLVGFTAASAQEGKPTAEHLEFFERKVRPLLVDHCYKCHSLSAQKDRGGFLLDSRAAILKGGDSGEAIVPGDPEKSDRKPSRNSRLARHHAASNGRRSHS